MSKSVSPLRSLVAAATVALVAVACQRDAQPAASTPEPAPPAESPIATPPLTAALDRQELLSVIALAAANYAAGAPSPGADPLVGRRFDIRLAFGCGGAEPPPVEGAGDGLARWSWGPEREAIALSLTPGDWTTSALIAGTGQERWEAVEGFWIARPWMSGDGCPSISADPLASGPTAASPQTVGLAAVFEAGGSRLGRRNGRAYAHTIRQSGETPLAAPEGGYRVRLEGRIAAFPGGRAIRCRAANPNQRPVCVAAAQLDRVAFETATGEVLSEWRPS